MIDSDSSVPPERLREAKVSRGSELPRGNDKSGERVKGSSEVSGGRLSSAEGSSWKES